MPMYFFLCNLSFADVGFTSSMVPKMIVGIHTHSSHLLHGLPETDVSIIFGCMDNLLLTVMAYDRFVTICHPLHYQAIMNPGCCGFLVLVSFGASLLYSLLQNLMVLRDSCFKKVEISNFFCEPTQLLSLTSSDSFTNDVFTYLVGIIYGFLPITGILLSYYNVVSSILRIPSAGGKYKAFSTCGSHVSRLLILCKRPWGLSQFNFLTFSRGGCLGFSGVHSGHPHAQPLYLQPEEQGLEESHTEAPQQQA